VLFIHSSSEATAHALISGHRRHAYASVRVLSWMLITQSDCSAAGVPGAQDAIYKPRALIWSPRDRHPTPHRMRAVPAEDGGGEG